MSRCFVKFHEFFVGLVLVYINANQSCFFNRQLSGIIHIVLINIQIGRVPFVLITSLAYFFLICREEGLI